LDQGLWNSLAAGRGPCFLCGIARLSEDARPHGSEFFSKVEWVHARGGTYRQKILVVVKEEFFRNTAIAQRAVHPLFKSPCDDGPPEPLLGGSMIPVLKNGSLKHGSPPWMVLYLLTLLTHAGKGPHIRWEPKKFYKYAQRTRIKFVLLAANGLEAVHAMPFW
jgi:hypothetical protein